MILHRHHRKRRSQGGGDQSSNILLVTPEIHDWIHANPKNAHEYGWLVKSFEEPEMVTVTIPHEITIKNKPRKKRERRKEKVRSRGTVSYRVPQDEREDGAGILDDLIQQARERLLTYFQDEDGGWSDNVPAYYVLVAVFVDWLNTSTTKEVSK